jgi:hypothetical protein
MLKGGTLSASVACYPFAAVAAPFDRSPPTSVRLLGSDEVERVPQTGAVHSTQRAEVTMPAEMLDQLWRPEYLEHLARSYWRHLRRVTLGLVRIVYGERSRTAVLISPRLPLLRFHAPEFETSADRGRVTGRIDRGLLVAGEGHDAGFLRITVSRAEPVDPEAAEATLRVELEVRNFYPWLRGSGRFARFGAWLYGQTQLRAHVLICNGFLRPLARLDLPAAQRHEV